jgi:hypothetical protein
MLSPDGQCRTFTHLSPSLAPRPAAKNNTVIHIAFDTFASECQYDYLFIYGGPSYQSPLLAAYSGDFPPEDLFLSLPAVRIEFAISNL